jgi:hypothetical protein
LRFSFGLFGRHLRRIEKAAMVELKFEQMPPLGFIWRANRRRSALSGEPTLCSSHRIVFITHHQHADPPHLVGLLRACRERQRRHPSKPSDELPAPHPQFLEAAMRSAYPGRGSMGTGSTKRWRGGGRQ